MTKEITNSTKLFLSNEKYQFICNTCGDKAEVTNNWTIAQNEASSHKKTNPNHDVDIIILHEIISRNNFRTEE
ncbi:MAG: hypothetical protein SFY56_14970 [Bacteroidota bacterium]|nr:hypothetical protein [Bacteroidota bacterium]